MSSRSPTVSPRPRSSRCQGTAGTIRNRRASPGDVSAIHQAMDQRVDATVKHWQEHVEATARLLDEDGPHQKFGGLADVVLAPLGPYLRNGLGHNVSGWVTSRWTSCRIVRQSRV